MSGALKWSPFESAGWQTAQDGAGRTPSHVIDAIGQAFDSAGVPFPVHYQEVHVEDVRVEEFVDREALVVRAEMPGADPDRDIEVSVAGGVLHIRAGRQKSDGRSDGNGFQSGLRYRPFDRTLPLPEGVTDTDIRVSFRDGVLEVRTPLPAAPLTDAPEKRLPISRD
ncbi:Hsp20/alpha crystallin family protein [Arthrobacter oryzae]|jgi:HSP20 family protein|uniref:Hsp20/alpha crystallin family protein n=1 Tax=Arthrobacter oryzae TaxID=409290 RepID=UPI0027827CF6|nr:Hsp20/alpha crystallin family protein [Arthrobacter oryzae]MDQ0077557.1 HSP20 family protein [Arthrobacter oryzae]